MKTKSLIVLMFSLSFIGALLAEVKGTISASLANPKYDPKGKSISVDFILDNQTGSSINLFERWNSWGTDQWWFIIQDSKGKYYSFINPQKIWTKNHPTIFEIKPSTKFTLKCKLLLREKKDDDDNHNISLFVNGVQPTFPITIRGFFESYKGNIESVKDMKRRIAKLSPDLSNPRIPNSNWIGKIFTNLVVSEIGKDKTIKLKLEDEKRWIEIKDKR